MASRLLIYFLIVSKFLSFAHALPTNTADGMVLPFQVNSSISPGAGIVEISISPQFASGRIEIGNPSSGGWSWNEALAPITNSILYTSPSLSNRFFRLRHSETSSVTLSATLRHPHARTNLTVEFEPLPGWSMVLQERDGDRGSWRSVAGPVTNETILIPEGASLEELRVLATPPLRRENYEAILIAGQSNAELPDDDFPLRFTNVVYLTTARLFRHPSQFHDALNDRPFAYSFSVEAAAALSTVRSRPYMLIPTAVGSTALSQWLPGSNRYDRFTLFGNANYRRLLAAPQGVRAIWYYGHESSTITPEIERYATLWKQLIQEFQNDLGPVPVIFAQLAKSTNALWHAQNFRGAEQQRLCEAGQPTGTPGHHMVVTFDLPLGDFFHLSGLGQRELGRRFALAMRQHVYGEAINGTGPRLQAVDYLAGESGMIRVKFDRTINPPQNAYDNQFTVSVANADVPILSVSRDAEGSSVLIEIERNSGPVTLRYGARAASGIGQALPNVVRDADGLPAPAFGPIELN